jgi:hypothetical protein
MAALRQGLHSMEAAVAQKPSTNNKKRNQCGDRKDANLQEQLTLQLKSSKHGSI